MADRRSLYRLVSEIMVGEDKTPLALRYLVKFFGTFSEERFPADVESLAKVSVINAIKSPVSSFSDRNALLEVRRLTNDADTFDLTDTIFIIQEYPCSSGRRVCKTRRTFEDNLCWFSCELFRFRSSEL